METFLPFLCLLLGSALTLIAIWLMVRRAVHQLDTAETYREVAQQLGLVVDTRGVSLRGHLDERRIWIGEVLEGFGTERRTDVRGILSFERSLGMGLLIRSRTRSERWFRRHSVELQTGDATLDARVMVQCDDPAALRLLLTPEVTVALLVLVERCPAMSLTDDEILVWLKDSPGAPDQLLALITAMARTAAALEAARRDIPAPHSLDGLVDRWRPLAEQLGMEIEPAWPAMIGTITGHRVDVVARREASGYAAMIAVHFGPHPELGLLIRPQVEPDGYWSVGQDIQVGDPAFDPRFVVKGWDPAAVCARLKPDARSALLALAERGPVVVDDRGVVCRGLSLDPADLREALTDALAAARGMGW